MISLFAVENVIAVLIAVDRYCVVLISLKFNQMAFCVFISTVKPQYLWHVDKCMFNCSMDIFPSLCVSHLLCGERCIIRSQPTRYVAHYCIFISSAVINPEWWHMWKPVFDAECYLNWIAKVASSGWFCKSRTWATHGKSFFSSSTSLCLTSIYSSRTWRKLSKWIRHLKCHHICWGQSLAFILLQTVSVVFLAYFLGTVLICVIRVRITVLNDDQALSITMLKQTKHYNFSNPAQSKWIGQM